MKRNIILLTYCTIALFAQAAVTFPLDYSNFFATSAVNLNGTDLETGNSSALNTWFLVGTANGTSPSISSNNLNCQNYIDNNVSKKFSMSSTITAARTTFFNFTSSATDLATGTYYLSFLMKVTSAPSGYVLLTNYTNSTTSNNARGRIQIKDNGSTTGYKLQPLAYNVGGVTTPDITYNVSHLFVVKYQIVTPSNPASTSNGSATITIYVDPVPGSSEPSATYTSTQSTVSNFDCLKSLVINQQPGLGAEISGLRFSTSWADVCKATAAPKLATPTVSTANPISVSGFTANWTAVANASSYDVKVYQNGSVVKTVNAAGQATSSITVNGLTNSLPCSYTVTAVGDGTNFSNSDPSSSQTVVMPLDFSSFFSASAINAGATSLETGNAAALGTWAVVGTANGSNPAISANDLTYSNYIDNSASKKISLASDVNASRSSLFYLTSSTTDMTTGPYYLSFLLKVNAAPATTATFITFANTNAGGQRGRVNVMAFGAGYQLGASLTGSTTYYATTLAFGTTYLVVLKQQISTNSTGTAGVNSDGAATTSIFVNPELGIAEPTANAIKTESNINSLDCIKSVIINQQAGFGADISGLRFSTNWNDVTLASTPTGFSNTKSCELIFANKTVIAPELGCFEVYSSQGVRILTANNMTQLSLPYVNGIYLVKFATKSGETLTRKIVIK